MQDQQILEFKTPRDWRAWLQKHYAETEGVWLKFYKKTSGIPTLTYDEALDEALCFGWIDGLANGLDEKSYLQRFTPRRPKSNWSKRNTEHIERLTQLGKMHQSGLLEVEKAKGDGRWERAYASPTEMKVPEDFLREVAKNRKANEFFKTLNKTNTYAIAWRLQDAKKPETRERRIHKFVEMLARGEKLH